MGLDLYLGAIYNGLPTCMDSSISKMTCPVNIGRLLMLLTILLQYGTATIDSNDTSPEQYNANMDNNFQCFQTCLCHMEPLPSTTIALFSSCSMNTPDMSLPDPVMGELYNVSVLHFEYAANENLPMLFCDVTDQLEHLAWRKSKVENLYDDMFSCLSTLVSLDLSDNMISFVPNGSFTGLFNLKYLAISRNNISELEANCLSNDLQYMEEINLSSNKLRSLPEDVFHNLSSLRQVNLSHNSLTSIEGSVFRGIRTLQVLDLSYNRLVGLSGVFAQGSEDSFGDLAYLNLSHNDIEQLIPGMFDGLIGLKELDLSFNHINTVPRGAFTSMLQGLINLQLSHNEIEQLEDEALAELNHLAALNLSNNVITEVNAELFTRGHNLISNIGDTGISKDPSKWARARLDVLDLSHNNISKVPRTAFESTLSNIRAIHLGHNHIQSLPRYGIETLKSLEFIDLQYNNIAWLDVGTFKNSRLRYISLSHNKLVKLISMAFLYLPEIEYVDLSHNKLNYLYKYIFYKTCSATEEIRLVINCDHNQLESDSIWKLLSTFRHLEGTTCSVQVTLRHNLITHLLGEALETYQRHLSYYDYSYFRTWDHVHFDISANPLECDCSMYDDAETLQGISSTFVGNFTHMSNLNFWESLTCSNPSHMQGRKIKSILPDISCVVTDFCSHPCQCVYIPSRQRYLVNCTSRRMSQFPLALPSGLKEVYLQGNNLQALYANISLYDIAHLDLSYNRLAYIDSQVWAKMAEIPVLYLHHNKLTSLSQVALEGINMRIKNLSVEGNPLGCTCEDIWIKSWAGNHSVLLVGGVASLRCGPGPLVGQLLVEVDDNDFGCPSATLEDPGVFRTYEASSPSFVTSHDGNRPAAFIPINILAFVLAPAMLVGFIVGIVVYRFRNRIRVHASGNWRPKHLDEDSLEITHDIFISFSRSDGRWVKRELISRLTSRSPPYSIHLQSQDWKTGALLTDYLLEGMDRCESVIVVFSHNLLHMEWTTEETKNCLQQLLQNRSKRTYVIFLDGDLVRTLNVEPDSYLRDTTCLNVQDQLFWEKLFYLLPPPRTQDSLLQGKEIKNSLDQDFASAHHKKY